MELYKKESHVQNPPGSQKPDFPFWGPRDYPADVLIDIFQDECLLQVLEIKVRREQLLSENMRREQVVRKQLRSGQLLSGQMRREQVVRKQLRSAQLLSEQMSRVQVIIQQLLSEQ
jgi:hypothetical protein